MLVEKGKKSYGTESSHGAFWQRMGRTAWALDMQKPALFLLGWISTIAEYNEPVVITTKDRLAGITDLDVKTVKRGLTTLRRAGVVVPASNRYLADQTRPPKGGGNKPVKYDINIVKVAWDLSGLNGLILWNTLTRLYKKRYVDEYQQFIGKMKYKSLQIIENDSYLILITCKDKAVAELFQAVLANEISDIATDLAGAPVQIIAQSG